MLLQRCAALSRDAVQLIFDGGELTPDPTYPRREIQPVCVEGEVSLHEEGQRSAERAKSKL